MEMCEFKELLLKSLQDADYLHELENVCGGNRAIIKSSDEQMSKYISKIHDLTDKNILLNKKIEDLKKEEYKFEKVNEELKGWRSLFGPMNNIIELYNGLTDKNKEALQGIFKDNKPDLFIVSGVQQGNIESLWEYAKIQIMKRQYKDINNMSGIIYYFIDLYNSTKASPVYELLRVNKGDMFDVELHIRTSESRPAGRIQKAVLLGFKNVCSGTVIKKSVVEL